jgi:multidrug efflux pump subunit AcrB
MMAQCDPKRGANTISLLESLRKAVESELVIPDGYRLKLYGEEESREESNEALASQLPTALLLIFVVLLLLFGSLRSTIAVVVTLPLIFVGVVLGLLLTGNMFDFFSLLGLLGLVGMNVKNGVILLTHIERVRASGIKPLEAVAHATADRFIPVVTASGTTVLGMVPLLFDSLFRSMAATIMGGLVVATLLVLLVLPTVYSLIYRIKQ